MKQISLYNQSSLESSDELCLTGLFVKWAFFGLAMWWLSSSGFWPHGMIWLIGLVVAFASLRKEFRT